MIKKIYSIYDEKAAYYMQPFFLNQDAEAIRAIADLIDKPDHPFAKHPQDYTLFGLGEYDELNGTFTTDHKRAIHTCLEIKAMFNIQGNDENMFPDKLEPYNKLESVQ